MKKIYLLTVLAFIHIILYSQNNFIDDSFFVDKTTITEDAPLTKDQLWLNLNTWISNTFNKYEGVVDLVNEQAGRVIIKSKSKLSSDLACMGDYGILYAYFTFTLQVDCKDNKYRIIISDRSLYFDNKEASFKRASNKTLNAVISQGKDFVDKVTYIFNGKMTWALSNPAILQLLNREYKNNEFNVIPLVEQAYKIQNYVITSLTSELTLTDDF